MRKISDGPEVSTWVSNRKETSKEPVGLSPLKRRLAGIVNDRYSEDTVHIVLSSTSFESQKHRVYVSVEGIITRHTIEQRGLCRGYTVKNGTDDVKDPLKRPPFFTQQYIYFITTWN